MGLVLRGDHALIEKKILIFGLFVLFLLPASALAADGDSSPESTIVFSETLPDDTMFYPDNETHGTGYAESFVDVSDWIIQGGDPPTTDGDVMSWDIPADASYDRMYVVIPDIDPNGLFLEFCYQVNDTGEAYHHLYLKSNDDGTGDAIFASTLYYNQEQWKTIRYFIESTGVAKSLQLNVIVYGANPIRIQFDYLRISNTTEMGWQHDGSTTAGTSNDADGGTTYTSSSDGDKLTFNMTWASGAQWSGHRILFDTTTTAADIERDYYPFYEIQFSVTTAGTMSSSHCGIFVYYDGYETAYSSFAKDGSDVTLRGNMKAEDSTDSKAYIEFYGYFNGAGDSIEFVIDWGKAYSIANFTVTQSSTTTDDYLYVDDGVLYSNIDDGYIELNHDPTLSVVPDTYPLYYNLITIGTVPEFSMYVSSWSTYSDETRGIISSRIVTDIKLKFSATEIISEIKFAMDDISIFSELFLSLDMWGYLGPMAMIVIGYVLAKKEKFLGVFGFS